MANNKGTRKSGSGFAVGGLLLTALLAAVAPPALANLDPAQCPFELGYNPVFNADGSVLSCVKGSGKFEVDQPNGIVARSLRGIGTSLQSIQIAATQLDLATFAKFLDPGVTFFLSDGVPRTAGDPVLVAFLLNPAVFTYAPGVDVHSIFEVSNYQFLGGSPTSASLHVRLITQTSYVDYDSVWRFNDVGDPSGRKLWQLFQAFNLVVTPRS